MGLRAVTLLWPCACWDFAGWGGGAGVAGIFPVSVADICFAAGFAAHLAVPGIGAVPAECLHPAKHWAVCATALPWGKMVQKLKTQQQKSVPNLENQFCETGRDIYITKKIIKCALLEEMFEMGNSVLDLDNHWMMEFLWSPAGEAKSHPHACRSFWAGFGSGHPPLQDGAWQLRVVIGRGSVQFWTETCGLEHMTWRSWVPFPQETEHCKYKQVNLANV